MRRLPLLLVFVRLLLYEGRTVNKVAEHLGHADPGVTARTYAHVMRDASKRRRVPIARAIVAARRPAAEIRPKKALQIKEADARIRTADPFITSVDQASPRVALGRAKPHESEETRPVRWRSKTREDEGVDPA